MALYYRSPMGWFKIVSEDDMLTWVGMVLEPDDEDPDAEQALEQEALCQLKAYFAGKLAIFDLPFTLGNLSPFSKTIFTLLLEEIGYGMRISYRDLAYLADSPGAMRAVGRAMVSNPISVIVPCHRVVGNKDLGNYAWPLSAKQWLLDHEERHKAFLLP